MLNVRLPRPALVAALISGSLTTVFTGVFTGTMALPATAGAQSPAQTSTTVRTAAQLDELVAPVALYADPLLAQLLLAATFPDEVRDAAAHVRANGTRDLDDQSWDVSVKAIAHYPTVLNLLDSRPEWMEALGEAYAAQSSDVMASVQRMRPLAAAKGNLVGCVPVSVEMR